MKLEKLQFVVEDGVGIITMNYMKNLNAIDDQMADELMYVVDTCENDPNVKVVVLKGMPKAFSAGGDIGYFYNLIQQGGEVNMDSLISKVGNVTDGLKRMSKLVISSVSGAAAGAGVSLAFSGDFVVCADNAKFIMAFVNLGLVPDTGGTYLFVKSLGIQKAMELCVTGRPMKAQEAKDAGMVYDVVPAEELDDTVMKLAKKFANGPLLSYKNIKKQIYHCNEGHAAFIGIERIRDLVNHKKLSFSEALEVIRSSSLFTTHTPVPAGHDAFPESMIRQYMSHYPDVLGITWEQYINLGKTNPNDPNEKFSMSVLACNLSQEVNGVSWLHGEVSKEILGNMWPGYFKNELHIGYVTNGVHFPTWIATSLRRLYARYFADGFEGHAYDIPAWQKVHNIPDGELWAERMHLKNKLIKHIRKRYSDPSQVRLDSPRQMLQVIEGIKPDVLTIGFARRFATYKRAYLLFTNLDRLSAIVNNKERPVQFIFAGKAHPNDKPGQDLIKRIVEVAAMPQFVGKILFLQNYDMELARRMVQGVDVWLNTPTRPLEASGTSGEKCVMNGVLQFSVLDGWWVEGYKEGAGWMLPMERTFADQHYQDELDAEMIYNTIEEQIVPKYYDRDKDGIPHAWVESVKKCVADIASNFTTNRMLNDYEERFYNKLAARKHRIVEGGYKLAREIAAWKRKVSSVWDQIRVIDVQRVKIDNKAIFVGEKYHFEVTVDIVSLRPEDIGVEMVIAQQIVGGQNANVMRTIGLKHTKTEGSRVTYALDYTPDEAGTFDVALRIFPENPHLPHRMDFALVKWA